MSVTLNPEQERIVNEKLKAGHYRNVEEVLTRALEMLQGQDSWLEENRDAISEKISRGVAQLDRGEGIPGDQARERLQAMKAARRTPEH